MKKFRKGFTLVELLIVIAILGTLSAAMSMSVTGATARAKAATIAANVNACITAARLYAINNASDGLDDLTADDVLFASLPSWNDFKDTTSGISYEALTEDDNKGEANWAITVDFSKDPEKDAIVDELQKIRGFKNSYATAGGTGVAIVTKAEGETEGSYKFQVTLTTGKIIAYSGS